MVCGVDGARRCGLRDARRARARSSMRGSKLTVKRLEIVKARSRCHYFVLCLRFLVSLHRRTRCPEVQERYRFLDAVSNALIWVLKYGLEKGLLRLHRMDGGAAFYGEEI